MMPLAKPPSEPVTKAQRPRALRGIPSSHPPHCPKAVNPAPAGQPRQPRRPRLPPTTPNENGGPQAPNHSRK